MTARYLFGPADDPAFADRFLAAPAAAGRWTLFGATDPPPDPGGFAAVLLWPGYASVPSWVWAAPVPVVALAHDPNLLWHGYRHLLPLCDLVLTDAPAADRLTRAGLGHVRAANLYGLDRHFLAELDRPAGERDIDVLFVGNLHPAVQADRLPWVARVARLAGRYRVVVAAGVFGPAYRNLLGRAKVCFNRSARGECNLRAFEAAAAGAVLLQEADNAEVRAYLEPEAEYVPYTATDLEDRLAAVLADDAGREAIAARARERVRGYAFETLIEAALTRAAPEWDVVVGRAKERVRAGRHLSPAGRVWQRAGRAGPDADLALTADLAAAGDDHGLALLAPDATAAGVFLARAAAGNRVSAVGHAAALVARGRGADAVDVLRRVIDALDADPDLTPGERDTCPYPVAFDHVRVGWERAGWDHPDDPAAEGRAKHALLRGRAWAFLAELTGEVGAFAAAVAACPAVPTARAAYGCARARAGHFAAAVDHLTVAVAGNPFDTPAAQALIAALADAGRPADATRVRADQARLQQALGHAPRSDDPPPAFPPAPPRTRFVPLAPDAFAARFGRPDTTTALVGFTPAADAHAVLALVAALRPRRLLEVGTAAGHMTANLSAWAPPDAVVTSLGVVAEDRPMGVPGGAAEQAGEVPPRAAFARHVNHFGTGHKVRLVTADSRTFDFGSLGPLDLAFLDGGHDFATARSDTAAAYAALRPGGCLVWHDLPSGVPWVRVREAVESLALPEPVYLVADTQVAFLLKGDGVPAAAGGDSARVAVAWDGEFAPVHSLAGVNRMVCAELALRGNDVRLLPAPPRVPAATHAPLPDVLHDRVAAAPGPADAVVRHRWPPDFAPPAGEAPFVLVQPWEYGRLPRAWVGPILDAVDEVWAYSRSVARAYVASGVPEDRLAVVPPGVDPDVFRPGLDPLPLPTAKAVRLLFVGGTIPRKGFDVLLRAYRAAFAAADDVALVVKGFGAETFYRGQTGERAVERFRADPGAPELVTLDRDLADADMPRLYAAADALVLPYRGEGFGLPALEAMACGLPVVVTAGGPTDEFAPPAAGWRIPARVAYFPDEAVDGVPTCGRPWWLEPDADALAAILRTVVEDAADRQRRGDAARRAALGWTWARTAAAVEDRVRVLRTRIPIRFRRPAAPAAMTRDTPVSLPAEARRPRVSLTVIARDEAHNLPACLGPVRDLVDEVVVVDTGSADRTVEVARGLGAKVSAFPWVDDFAAARNAALDQARGEWVFWLDADDRLGPADRPKLAALLAGLGWDNAAYVMKCVCAPEAPGAAATAVDHVRLFRRDPRHRWRYRVHEQILPALRATGADVRWSGVAVTHVGYVDAALRRRKLARDLRLLRLEDADRPVDPFTLFNLGSVYHEQGAWAAAAAALEGSLARSHPKDSIVRKAYALLAQCRRKAGDPAGAGAAVREGRGHYPDDAELLFLAAGLARDAGDLAGAEGLLVRLVEGSEPPHFASVDTGLRGHKGRHNLAALYLDQGRLAEAEAQWQAAVADHPGFVPAHLGLGEVALRRGDRAGVEAAAATLRQLGAAEAADALAARWDVARHGNP